MAHTKQKNNTVLPTVHHQAGDACCAPVAPSRLQDEEARAAAELFKALADPARLQILDILGRQAGEVCVCDLEGNVGLPDEQTGLRPKQPTISHHLRVLRDVGLVDCEKRGVWAYYFLCRERLAAAQRLLGSIALGMLQPAKTEAQSPAEPVASIQQG